MWRWLQLCALLVGLLCGAILLLIGWGRTRAVTGSALGFNRCALPCFAGITPGLTNVLDARYALSQLTESRGTEQSLHSGKWVYSTNTLQILLDTDFQHATRLDIDSIQQPTLISLGDTLLTLGAPSMIYALPIKQQGHYELFLNYSTADYGVYFLFHVSSALSPTLPADAVKIYTLNNHALSVPLFPTEQGHPWRGFGRRSLDGLP